MLLGDMGWAAIRETETKARSRHGSTSQTWRFKPDWWRSLEESLAQEFKWSHVRLFWVRMEHVQWRAVGPAVVSGEWCSDATSAEHCIFCRFWSIGTYWNRWSIPARHPNISGSAQTGPPRPALLCPWYHRQGRPCQHLGRWHRVHASWSARQLRECKAQTSPCQKLRKL